MADFEINLESFKKELDKFTTEELPKKVTQLQKKVVLEALRRLIEKTPVDTGRARGGWLPSLNTPSKVNVKDIRSTAEVEAEALRVLTALKPMQVVWISNNVDYIEFLEEGHSQQAPAGMVAITIAELQAEFNS